MRIRVPLLRQCALAVLALHCLGAAAADVDLGQASVLSQRGQRLKIAIPFGSSPVDRPSVTRFRVEAVSVPQGYPSLRPEDFTISKPASRNVVFLQSDQDVSAPNVKLSLAVIDDHGQPTNFDLWVPPARAAASTFDPAAANAARPVGRRPIHRSHRARQSADTAAQPALQSPASQSPGSSPLNASTQTTLARQDNR